MKDIKSVLTRAKRSKIVKQAKKGKDFGKKGKGFDRGVEKLEKEGKSADSARKIMGAQFWKQVGKK